MRPDLHEYIYGMWLALGVLWFGGAVTAKRKNRVESTASRIAHIAVMALAFSLLFKPEMGFGPLGTRFIPEGPPASYTGLALTIAGVLLAAFARLCLGGNWSAVVAIKDDHQLVRSGPYAFVRHPIYTGLLLGMLGTAIAFGEWRGLAGFLLAIAAFRQKARLEEQFLIQQFGSEYERYRTSVKALIPFIL
jgi:protein-S-isoprenylcysteine O-methyltransferase Ste14